MRSRQRGSVLWLAACALSCFALAARIAVALCPGDCDSDGEVDVPELMLGVGAALSINPLGLCPQFDTDVDERVTVNEILGAIDVALSVCPLDPTVSFQHTYPGSFFGDTGTRGHAVALADLETDGHLDVIIADLFGRRGVSVFRGRGDGAFSIGRHFEAGHTPVAMVTGDFNGDQRIDVAVTGEAMRLLTVVLGRGDGTMGPPSTYPVRLNPRALAAADLNQDGVLDIVVVNRGSHDLSVFLGRGDGTFQVSATLPSAGSSPDGIAIADLNRDNDPDLVVANRGSGTLAAFLGEAGGGFGTPTILNVPLSPFSLTAGDFNEDGIVDVVVTSLGTDILSFVPGNGDGTFGTARRIIEFPSVYRVVSADLNGDSHLDLVAGATINAETVMSLLGRGDGSFELAIKFNSDGGEVFALDLGDVTEDGIPDLVTNSGLTLRGNGGGTFATASGLGFWPVAATDVNGDGHSDIVTTNHEGLGVALGSGTGTFTEPRSTPGLVRSPIFGDLDRDRLADAVALAESGDLMFYRGQSDGLFSQGQPIEAVGQPIAITDVNHDGVPDLFLSDSILLGNGDGTLQTTAKFIPPELFWCASEHVAFADLNGDGHLDLVTAPPNTFVGRSLSMKVRHSPYEFSVATPAEFVPTA